jgi:predicted RNase H-like HicB family nuclease
MNDIDPKLWEQAKSLAARNYEIEVSQDELTDGTQIFVVENPELVGCMAQGETLLDAIQALNEGRIDFIYFLLVDGLVVPPPRDRPTTTGTGIGFAKISFTEIPANPEKSVGELTIDTNLHNTLPQTDNDENKVASISVIDGDFVEHE